MHFPVGLIETLNLDMEEQKGSSYLKSSQRGKGEKPQTRGNFIERHKKTTKGVDH